MAREFEFVQVDVFTERILAGNGLAVLLDARGLDDREIRERSPAR
jgi:predicted PhzF superfamily epimerase YddE/YHI9